MTAPKLDLKPIPSGEAPASPPTVDQIVENAIAAGTDVAGLTALYLKLRAAKSDIADQAKTKTAPINKGLSLIENHLLDIMNEMKVDSLKNDAGTPYKAELASISVADNSTFVEFVLDRSLAELPVTDEARIAIRNAMIDSGYLALIEARASKTAVEAYLQETEELPPGLNRSTVIKLNVRST